MEAEERYYKNLFKNDLPEEKDDNNNFFSTEIKTLTNESKQLCEGKLNEYECGIALLEMSNNKSPGSDGLTVEFYKMFWNTLKPYYINSMNYSFGKGELTELQKQIIITLLPKPGKDLDYLANWRPISLLNTDYKIATKTIANRIKKCLPEIISFDQTGFMKNRYIGENVRLIFDVIEHLNATQKPGLFFVQILKKSF